MTVVDVERKRETLGGKHLHLYYTPCLQRTPAVDRENGGKSGHAWMHIAESQTTEFAGYIFAFHDSHMRHDPTPIHLPARAALGRPLLFGTDPIHQRPLRR